MKPMDIAREKVYNALIEALGAARITTGVVVTVDGFDVVITPVVKKDRIDLDFEVDAYAQKVMAAQVREADRLAKADAKVAKEREKANAKIAKEAQAQAQLAE